MTSIERGPDAATAPPARGLGGSAHEMAMAGAHEQLAAIRSKELSSVEMLEIVLDRVGRHNGTLNALVSFDEEGARTAARRADDATARGDDLGPLHGLPISVKDSYETAGLRTTCGQKRLADYVPAQDAEAVRRLRHAGAVIFAKSNLPTGNQDVQASNPVFGRTNNPWDLDRSPGGSAGGGAAATAVGMTALDFGSEIGGSTRIPSHYCGLFGHKASTRSVPLAGHIPYAPGDHGRWSDSDLGTGGLQARSARDILAVLRAVTGSLFPSDGWSYSLAPPRATDLTDFRVAAWFEDPACPVDADVREAMNRAIATLEHAGATVVVEPTSLPVSLAESHRVFERLLYGYFSADRSTVSARMAANLVRRLAQNPRGGTLDVIRGVTQTHSGWLKTHAMHEYLRVRWSQFFDQFDVLLLPVTPTAALPHHDRDHDLWGRRMLVDGVERSYWDQTKWNGLANLAGAPATTIPTGLNSDGLPIGIQAMGPSGGDLTTIEFAALLAEAMGAGHHRPPAFVD